jgi:uncharacterized protein (DUF58 family)
VREALRALTRRGRAFVGAGCTAIVLALVLGQKDLLRVGILLAALPLVTVAVIARARYQVSCRRDVQPRRVATGEPSTVTLRLENAGRMPTGILLLEDGLPYALGARPRFVIDHMGPRWRQDVAYQVRSELRGRFALGPLSVRVSDPFGFVELTRSFPERDMVTVTPQTQPLPATRLSGEWSGTGDNRPRAFASAGSEDVTVREYRQGDDLRRVHWPSTARSGELMVRREEQPWQSRATIVLDTRLSAHRGSGPKSSFEWAIVAAASVGVHLARRGFAVRLTTDADLGGRLAAWHDRGSGRTGETETLLETLAVAKGSNARELDLQATSDQASPGLVVAITGLLEPGDLRFLGRLRHGSGACLAIVLDTASWAATQPTEQRRIATRAETAASGLRRQGWQVAIARAGDQVGPLWEALATGIARRSSVEVPPYVPDPGEETVLTDPQPAGSGA